jgi:tyrosine-specific transport protein
MAKYKNEIIGAASLLAGTAIGSGMISLPMVLAKFGIIGACGIMLAFMFLIYFTALIRADISLNINEEASSLKQAGEKVGSPWIGIMGDFSLKILAFALITAYMTGGASIITSILGYQETPIYVLAVLSITVASIFFFGSNSIVCINKILFSFLIVTLFALIAFLFYQTPINFIPQKANSIPLNEWGTIITVVFTSFGFHTVTHAVAKICHNDRDAIKKACLLGTAIPTVVYICWTGAILFVVANTDANFFQLMLEGKATNVGELVKVLSFATSNDGIQKIIWIVSALAIFTSILGVGFSLWHSVREGWKASKCVSTIIVAVLPAIISVVIPNAFITVLSVAGILLSVVAIISPVLISIKIVKSNSSYKLLAGNKFILLTVLASGILIIILGFL